jgi:hypothetical protein
MVGLQPSYRHILISCIGNTNAMILIKTTPNSGQYDITSLTSLIAINEPLKKWERLSNVGLCSLE